MNFSSRNIWCLRFEIQIYFATFFSEGYGSHRVAANYCALVCGVVGEGLKQSRDDDSEQVLYYHENAMLLANLFLV